jgi:hypothetical protein
MAGIPLIERPMKARVEAVIRNGIIAGLSPENIAMLVFATLRDPSEAMCDNVMTELGRRIGSDDAKEVWQRMIDAALAE